MSDRPNIHTIGTGDELRRWYWRKDELVAHARHVGVKTSGAKFTVLARLAHYLDTGETRLPSDQNRKLTSKFDWKHSDLSDATPITDNDPNTQNVRRFFLAHIGPGFRFNIRFMDWMKANVGRTRRADSRAQPVQPVHAGLRSAAPWSERPGDPRRMGRGAKPS